MADGSRPEYLEARALGDALKISPRGVRMRAEKEGWPTETRTGVGGKTKVYPLATLPEDVRAALARHRALQAASNAPKTPAEAAGRVTARGLKIAETVDAASAQRERERGQAAAAGLTGKARERMEAKTELLARLTAFADARGVGKCAAMDEFCDAYNSGAMEVPHYVRHHTGADLHPQTLRRWARAIKQAGTAALAGAYGNRRGSGFIESRPELLDFIKGVIAEKPTISAKLLHDAIDARMPQHLPKKRTLERFLLRWKAENPALFMAISNPDAWKNRHMPAFGSYSDGIVRVNQLWMADSTPADVMLKDGRHSLIGVIDVATRRFKLHVSKTSSADAVCQLTRRTIIAWGVAEAIKMDNGRDYASERVGALLTGLGIEARFSTPFSPWEKPHSERAFRTFSHGLLTLLPGYIGHDVAEAQAIRAREAFSHRLFKKNEVVDMNLTAAELQAFADRWCEQVYMHEPHSGEGMDGLTPALKLAQQRDVVRMVQDVRALDVLMGAGQVVKVQKKGVRLDKLTYIAEDLGALVGEQVLVRRDEGDIGRIVVYHRDAFLCIAECPEVTGVSMKEIAIEGRRQATAEMQRLKREMKALGKKAKTAELAEDILRRKAEQNASLTPFPAPNVAYMTPAIEAASEAADALARYDSGAPTQEEELAKLADVIELVRDEQRADDSAEQRFATALATLLKPEAERNDLERMRLKTYQSSAEFTSRWELLTEFGAEMFGLSADFNALLPTDAPFNKQGAF